MARVDVLWTDEAGAPRVAPATLEDSSSGGLSMRMKNPIPVGSLVTVRWGSKQASGAVTYCRQVKTDYVLGVKRAAGEESERK